MFWKQNKYIILLVVYATIFSLLLFAMPEQPDWTPTFASKDKIPFGTYIIKDRLQDVVNSEGVVQTKNSSFYSLTESSDENNVQFISICDNLNSFSELDVHRLLDFIAMGNEAFLSADKFSYPLLDTLGLSTNYSSFGKMQMNNPMSLMSNTEHDMTLGVLPHEQWTIQGQQFAKYFTPIDVNYPYRVLGHVSNKPNFITMKIGEGFLYLHHHPWVFTNFNILQEDGTDYAAKVLSYLDGNEVWWDEYYKPQNKIVTKSPLATILQFDSARRGVYIAVGAILLYMFFHVKRKQRPVPEIVPPKNESVLFSKTLGDLYFQRKNHVDIAEKKIKYLKEYLHDKYRMKEITFKPEEVFSVAQKSGRDVKFIEGLFKMASQVESRTNISTAFLESLSKKIHQFYDRK